MVVHLIENNEDNIFDKIKNAKNIISLREVFNKIIEKTASFFNLKKIDNEFYDLELNILLVIGKDIYIYIYRMGFNEFFLEKVKSSFYAIGSVKDEVIGAMCAGLSPKKAIECVAPHFNTINGDVEEIIINLN